MNPTPLVSLMSATMATPPPPPPVAAHPPPMAPPPPDAGKAEPWGQEDPLLWSARRARLHAIWGSAAIALFVLMFGAGMYSLFTAAIYDGGIEGHPSLILLVLSPFLLAIVGAVATGALARNVGRMSRQPLAPAGAGTARSLLWFSVFLWLLLFIIFPLSLTVTTEPGEGGDEPFPIGIITVLPVYIGFCVAIYTTGAAYAAWSDENKVESILIIGLAWAAFAMFLLLPAVINSWDLGSETPNVDWDSAVWWLRFGNLFPAIAPWLIVVGLYFIHGRNITLLEEAVELDGLPPTHGAPGDVTSGDACPRCGGSISTHPRTLETFCSACGWGLQPEGTGPVIVDASPAPTHGTDLFVEQPRPAAPAPPVQEPAAPATMTCSRCGGELAVLSRTRQIYCTACGAGLPSGEGPAPPVTPPPVPPPAPAAPQAPVSPPTTQPSAGAPPGPCPLCGAPTTVHPRTGERFCPACGAGLGPG